MEKKKDKSYKKVIVGIGFYKEEEWERLLACAHDRENLEDTYDEWLEVVEKAILNYHALGIRPRKVVVNLDELIDFCIDHKLKNTAETRSRFVAERLREGKAEDIKLPLR